jgi:DNA-binding NarL/FixJ family response regulator
MKKVEPPHIMKKRTPIHQVRLFIIDDYPIVRQGLTQLVAQEPGFVICGQSAEGEQALKSISQVKPDLVILDIALRGMNGLELIRQIKSSHPHIRILVLSMLEESLYAERALRAGANGYVMKGETTEKLLLALQQVIDGKMYVSKALSDKLLKKFSSLASNLQSSPVERLSDRELQVFRLIGMGRGTLQIAEELGLSTKTIDTYREHIKLKLDLADAGALREYAIRWARSDKLN